MLSIAWRPSNKRIDEFLKHNGYSKCTIEHEIYVKGLNRHYLYIVGEYVDDLLITRSSHIEIHNLKLHMSTEFDMIDIGGLKHFLGLEFDDTGKGMVIHQMKHLTDILKRINIPNYKHAPL